MADPSLRVARAGDAVWVTLNRPPLNLLEPTILRALAETFSGLASDPTVRVAVITGSGRAFTAGMDVRVLRDLDVAGAKALIATVHAAIASVHDAPFPVIAALNGPALGAGFELALACDLRFAASGALLGLPEVRVGVPSVVEAALLPAMVGPGRAAEMLFSGESITAETALASGLVNRVLPLDALRETVEAVTAKILACGPSAIRLQKELIIHWRQTDLRSAVQYGINAFAAAYATGEPREGAVAFLEKRPPKFRTGP